MKEASWDRDRGLHPARTPPILSFWDMDTHGLCVFAPSLPTSLGHESCPPPPGGMNLTFVGKAQMLPLPGSL